MPSASVTAAARSTRPLARRSETQYGLTSAQIGARRVRIGDSFRHRITALLLPSAHAIRNFLRASAATAVGARQRAALVPRGARAGRARRRPRDRSRVGGRAPLPRGVFALLRARSLPRRRLAAHDAED